MAGREGTRFGPYLLTRRLGSGAAGEVYLAEGSPTAPSASGPAQIAIKVLSGSEADLETREIARQAERAGGLRQPHIIPFYGIVADDGALGVAMAFAPGGSLGDALSRRGTDGTPRVTLPLPVPVAARVVVQVARALDAAHAAGLVHADIKPNNVFVRTSPSGNPLAVLSDFGQGVLTQTAVTLASQGGDIDPRRQSWADAQLLFAAPEQAHGEQPGPAADQYALAALAYLLLVGTPPISGSGPSLVSAIVSQAVIAPSRRNADLPTPLDAVLLRALAKDPGQRFPSVGAFAEALDDALAAPAETRMQRSGVTAGMAQLSGSHPALRGPLPGASSPGRSGSRSFATASLTTATDFSTAPVTTDVPIPAEDASPGINRRLAIISGSAMLLVVLSCVLVLRAFTGGTILPQIHLGGAPTSPNATASPRANASATAVASTAQARLTSATSGQPQFQDGLTSNANHWQTSAKALFFAKDGYHVANHLPNSVVTVDAPGAQSSYATLVVRCDVDIAQGSLNDFAGLRAFVASNGDFYAFLVAPEGKYQIWQHVNGAWTMLIDGFAGSYNVGLGQKNTLEILADSQNVTSPQAWFFINGHFVNTVALDPQGPYAGDAGLIVKDANVEAIYSNFTVYGSGG